MESKAGLIKSNGNFLIRTSKTCPDKDISSQLESLLHDRPAQDAEIKLMRTVGQSYGKCLSGEVDAVQLLFGSTESRSLLDKLYATSDGCDKQPPSAAESLHPRGSQQLVSIRAAFANPRDRSRDCRDMGTSVLLPALAQLDVPLVYTMTDISPSLVTQASSTFRQ